MSKSFMQSETILYTRHIITELSKRKFVLLLKLYSSTEEKTFEIDVSETDNTSM